MMMMMFNSVLVTNRRVNHLAARSVMPDGWDDYDSPQPGKNLSIRNLPNTENINYKELLKNLPIGVPPVFVVTIQVQHEWKTSWLTDCNDGQCITVIFFYRFKRVHIFNEFPSTFFLSLSLYIYISIH